MFYIMSGETLLHHPFSETSVATSAKLVEELNTQGSLDFTLLNPPIQLGLRSPIEVYDDDGLRWRGRVLSVENGFDGRKTYHCEGMLAALCDTILKPFSFRGRPDDSGNVNGLFHEFINRHNAQLSQWDANDPRLFTLGICSGTYAVHDPNNFIYRSSESAMTTWDAINSRLIDTLGGYIYLSGDDLNVINYVSDFPTTSGQKIEFGENLIDLIQLDSADSVASHLYAYGAQYDKETSIPPREVEPGGPDQTGYLEWNGNRLFVNYSRSDCIDRWGDVYATVVFDDITTAENLSTAANNWLKNNLAEHVESIECNAADLALIDVSIDKINVGNYVHVICEPLVLDTTMLCIRKETDLIEVSQTKISIGRPQSTLSGMVGG